MAEGHMACTPGSARAQRALVHGSACLAVALALAAACARAEEGFEWMPAEAGSETLRSHEVWEELIIPEVALTPTPKPTADASKFTNVYVLELDKFNISNDGTHPVETSKGINAALQHAKAIGANRIVFPKGTYLISESDPVVVDLKNAIIDLNGATLRINPNGSPRYTVMELVNGAENVRITNGFLKGDRDSHDFKTEKGSHEWGHGITFTSGRNLEVDHLVIRDMTGDGVSTRSYGSRTRPEMLAMIMYNIYPKHLEQGGFDERGRKVAGTEKIRTMEPLDVTKCNGQFEFGYSMGYQGFPYIKSRVYQAYFYDEKMNFLRKGKYLQYRKVTVPPAARFMHLEFNQAEVPDTKRPCGRITNFRPPTDVHFHHNVLSNNRRLGMGFCGGQRWLIEDNLFEKNGGTAPAYGVDYEDGWDLTQDVVFRNNKFRDNQRGDLVVCAGSQLVFEGNEFENTVFIYHRTFNYHVRNNRFLGKSVGYNTVTGVLDVRGNRYENCMLSVKFFSKKTIGDGFYHKGGARVPTPPITLRNETLTNVKRITGTYFDFVDSRLSHCRFVADENTRLVRFRNCAFDDVTIHYGEEGPQVDVVIENCKGTLKQEGPGLGRRKLRR